MKKVQFTDIIIFYKVGSSKDDKAARNGLQDIIDRERFQIRINKLSLILNHVLRKKLADIEKK